MTDYPGRVVDAGLQLLDRQLIDVNGEMAGNVDDLELSFPDEGTGPPIVTAILAGPGALARRIGGRMGIWIESVHSRLHPHADAAPARIPFGIVKRFNAAVHLWLPRAELEVDRFEKWVRETIVSHVPGAGHSTDEGDA